MKLADLYMVIGSLANTTILVRTSNLDMLEVYKGCSSFIPCDYFDYYVFNVEALDNNELQIVISSSDLIWK